MTNPGNAVGTNGAYGGRTSVNAFNDNLSQYKGRGILSGWQCVPKENLTLSLGGQEGIRDVAIAENDLGQFTTIDNISTQPIDIILAEAPPVGKRIDVIVGYVNNPPQNPTKELDNPSACGIAIASSNVSENPATPDESSIRAAITADGGSGGTAYYAVLAVVQVGTAASTITAEDIARGGKVEYRLPCKLKTYFITPDSNGIINIVDNSQPSLPTEGLMFALTIKADTNNPQIRFNNDIARGIAVQHFAPNSTPRTDILFMQSYNNYFIAWVNGGWRALNMGAKIWTDDIVDGAINSAKIANGSVGTAELASGAVTAVKLAQTGMYSPMFTRDFAVATDTPVGWQAALGNHNGRYWNYYDTTGKFAAQPSQYGFLETIIDNANIIQYWHEQTGTTKMRVGNAQGWMAGGGWHDVLHAGDYGLGGKGIWKGSTDFNDYPNVTGFYCGVNAASRPGGINTDVGYSVEQIVYDSGNAWQILRPLYSYERFYMRAKRGGTWSAWRTYRDSEDTLNQLYPVGSIYTSHTLDTAAKVAAALGGGTWVATSAGYALVGVDTSQTEFNASGKTGGAKTITLTLNQIPSHAHNSPSGTNGFAAHISTEATTPDAKLSTGGTYTEWVKYAQPASAGGGQAHNNLQPYSTKYMWLRTA